MSEETKTPEFEWWAILELMGHRRLGGYVREATIGGLAMLRIDVPGGRPECVACHGTGWIPASNAGEGEGAHVCRTCPAVCATQFYSPAALYCLTPTTEEIARAVAAGNRPAPLDLWELPAPAAQPARVQDDDDRADGPDDRDDDDR